MESARRALSKDVRRTCRTRKDGTETWAGNLVSRRGRCHPAPGRPFSAPATMPPEAQQPPRPAADPPQPQHGTRHHYDRRERHPLRRCGSLCGHRRSSLCASASPPAACSLTSPPHTASSSARQVFPSDHAAAAAINPASKVLVPVITRRWQPPGVAAALRATGACQCSSMARDSKQPPGWPSEAPLALRMASPGALFAFLRA